MFLRKEKKELFERMQKCLDDIQTNNAALADAVKDISENQAQIKNELSSVQANSIDLSNAVKGVIENENNLKENMGELQTNNEALKKALGETLETNRKSMADMDESREKLQKRLEELNDSNIKLAGVVSSISDNQKEINGELISIQANNIKLSETVGSVVENESMIKSGMGELHANSEVLKNAIGEALETNRRAMSDIDESREMFQKRFEELNDSNIKLAGVVSGIADNQKEINGELINIQTNNIKLSEAVGNVIENESMIKSGIGEMQSNNESLRDALGKTLETNRRAMADIDESREQLGKIIDNVQTNNLMLADTLHSVVESQTKFRDAEERKQYSDDEKWKAAYALNLCTVSISQIIEYNDLRFMDQEYENILNNLNLEIMPKDEALLNVLKQILDVITFFRIQDKERKMLDKEYQYKMKNAIWSAVPGPSAIINGGSGGLAGLAITAVISVGTGYMNYRKEKAKIGLEQERKEWELERSLVEQLHGLRRQLFETSWRLAEEYQFTDDLRLTEKQIKQFNEILLDDDPLRQYNRLEYVQKYYDAYPPFWYYLGAAALKIAYNFYKELSENDEDREIYKNYIEDYLKKSKEYFEYFFKKSAYENKLLREDPVVVQCAFEYVALLELQGKNGMLKDMVEKQEEISEKIKLAEESSGNSLDALQMCAVHYLSSDSAEKAIPILKMLVNEHYNVASNAHLLSMLYSKLSALPINESMSNEDKEKIQKTKEDAKRDHDILTKTCPYKIEFYPLPEDGQNFDELDEAFIKNQNKYLINRCLTAVEAYIFKTEKTFNDIWSQNYDISEEIVEFFEDFTEAMKVLMPDEGETAVRESISGFLDSVKDKYDINELIGNVSLRRDFCFKDFVENAVVQVVEKFNEQLKGTNKFGEISLLETKLLEFCSKYSLVRENDMIVYRDDKKESSIESVIAGKSIAQLKREKEDFDECVGIVKQYDFNDDKKKISYFYHNQGGFENYKKTHNALISSLNGKALAVIETKKHEFIFTVNELCIVSNGEKEEYRSSYEGVNFSNNNEIMDNKKPIKTDKIDSDKLIGMINELKGKLNDRRGLEAVGKSYSYIMESARKKLGASTSNS